MVVHMTLRAESQVKLVCIEQVYNSNIRCPVQAPVFNTLLLVTSDGITIKDANIEYFQNPYIGFHLSCTTSGSTNGE